MPDARAPQGLFHQRLVGLDVAKQDRDAIEWRALSGKRANAAGDFDALEAFAGGGEEQRRVGRGGRRRLGRKEPGADAIERCSGRRSIDIFRRHAEDSFERWDGVVAGGGCGEHVGRSLHECGEEPFMGGGFDGQAEQQDGEGEREAVVEVSGFGFVSGETEEHRQIGDGALLELLFVEREEMGEVGRGSGVLQAQFGDGFGESAGEARCLSDGGEVRQTVRGGGGVNNSRGQRLNAEARDGSQRETAHGLRREMGGELGESEGVDALTARREGVSGQFIGSGSRGGDDKDFSVLGFRGQEPCGVLEQYGVGAGVNERARGHRQLYWVEICYGAAFGVLDTENSWSCRLERDSVILVIQ